MRLSLTFLLIAIVFSRCSETVDSAADLEQYILDPDNGLKKSVQANGYLVDVIYRPSALLIAQDLRATGSNDTTTISGLKAKYDRHHYLVLSLSKDGKEILNQSENPQEYTDLLQVIAFRMDEYATLISGADTLDVSDFQMDRTFGHASTTNVIFAFAKTDRQSVHDINFHLNEFGLGIGNQSFIFKSSDLKSIPELSFKTGPDGSKK